jgi:hypothetical protein
VLVGAAVVSGGSARPATLTASVWLPNRPIRGGAAYKESTSRPPLARAPGGTPKAALNLPAVHRHPPGSGA